MKKNILRISGIFLCTVVLAFPQSGFSQNGKGKGIDKKDQRVEKSKEIKTSREDQGGVSVQSGANKLEGKIVDDLMKGKKEYDKNQAKLNKGKSKSKSDKEGKKSKSDKNKSKSDDKSKSDEAEKSPKKDKGENSGKGNAYGKDKPVEGKEFGQMRADEAKTVVKKNLENAEKEAFQTEQELIEARGKIKKAKERLESEETSGKLSVEEYRLKMEKILEAEQKVNDLDIILNKKKTELMESRKKLAE